MSAHVKHRRAFHLTDGAYAEVVVNIHNVDPTPADLILTVIMRAAEHAVSDYKETLGSQTKREEADRQQRVRALLDQVAPTKVISHGSAELHSGPVEDQIKPPAHVVTRTKSAKGSK